MSKKKSPESKARTKARVRPTIARGVVAPLLKKRRCPISWPNPPGNISDEVMERLRREEREGR